MKLVLSTVTSPYWFNHFHTHLKTQFLFYIQSTVRQVWIVNTNYTKSIKMKCTTLSQFPLVRHFLKLQVGFKLVYYELILQCDDNAKSILTLIRYPLRLRASVSFKRRPSILDVVDSYPGIRIAMDLHLVVVTAFQASEFN